MGSVGQPECGCAPETTATRSPGLPLLAPGRQPESSSRSGTCERRTASSSASGSGGGGNAVVSPQRGQHFGTHKLEATNGVLVTHIAILSPQAHVPDADRVPYIAQLLDDLVGRADNHLVVVLRFLVGLTVEWFGDRPQLADPGEVDAGVAWRRHPFARL